MPIQTSDNKWSVSKWIVDPIAGLGTHTTIQDAVDDAYNQDGGGIVCIRTGEYTENIVLPPNICLTSLGGDSVNGIIQIIGKVSMTQAGLSSIYGLYFNTNGDVAIEVSGSAASLLFLYDCNLRSSANNLINFSSSSSSAELVLNNCSAYLFTTGISLFTSTSAGQLGLNHVTLTNVANSTTSSTISAGRVNLTGASFLQNGITSSGTGSILVRNASIDTSGNNSTCLTCGGSGLHQVVNSFLASGTATALTANTTTSIYNSTVSSSNTNAIDGSGALNYAGLVFSNTSKISTTTQTVKNEGPSKIVGSSNSGGTNTLTVTNTSNTASSSSAIISSVGGTSAADPVYQSTISGTQTWTWGADNSDSDSYVLAGSSALGTTNVMRVATSGEVNFPLQPGFLVYQNSDVNNVTGNGTNYYLGNTDTGSALTVQYDVNSDFTSGASGGAIFTAPVTGKYFFTMTIRLAGISTATDCRTIININGTYTFVNDQYVTFNGNIQSFTQNTLVNLSAGNTVKFGIALTGVGADTADISGLVGGNRNTYISGCLLA